ncbi:MAG: alpha/beta hydrolase [Phycisphaerae bacterium]|jgi:pimeloyl-ACP methyl ester carboxylesterase|nr:alpha/beta hydrolase [Phycisphaerae bacterium]
MPVKLHYETIGQGDPLILIMGLGAPGSLWELHAEAYSRYFRCIMPDNRGAGESPKPDGPYTTEMMAEDTLAMMDDLNIDSARLAGISMGSAIAQSMALLAPGRVKSMVLISSWARCVPYMKDVFEHFSRIRPLVTPEHFMQLLQLWIFAPGHFSSNYEDLLVGRAEAEDDPMADHAFGAQCAACSEHDTLDRLGEIQTPCLLTVGDADIFTPLRCSREMHDRLPNSELSVFPGLGHCHHWEDLKTFNETTTKFLQSH